MIIALGGKAGSGKDTLAAMLQEMAAPGDVELVSFASGPKDCCEILFGWNLEKDESGRRLLQRFGTECARYYDQNCWIRLTSFGMIENGYIEARAIFKNLQSSINSSASLDDVTSAEMSRYLTEVARLAMALYIKRGTHDNRSGGAETLTS